jgi:hypothetical protein
MLQVIRIAFTVLDTVAGSDAVSVTNDYGRFRSEQREGKQKTQRNDNPAPNVHMNKCNGGEWNEQAL